MALLFRQRVLACTRDGCSAESDATIKGSDARRDGRRSGGYEPREFFQSLSFISMGVRERERGDIGRREGTYVAIAGRIGGLCYGYIYSRLYRSLVS